MVQNLTTNESSYRRRQDLTQKRGRCAVPIRKIRLRPASVADISQPWLCLAECLWQRQKTVIYKRQMLECGKIRRIIWQAVLKDKVLVNNTNAPCYREAVWEECSSFFSQAPFFVRHRDFNYDYISAKFKRHHQWTTTDVGETAVRRTWDAVCNATTGRPGGSLNARVHRTTSCIYVMGAMHSQTKKKPSKAKQTLHYRTRQFSVPSTIHFWPAGCEKGYPALRCGNKDRRGVSSGQAHWLRQKRGKRALELLVTPSSPSAVQKILEQDVSIQKANPTIKRLSEDRSLNARKIGHNGSKGEGSYCLEEASLTWTERPKYVELSALPSVTDDKGAAVNSTAESQLSWIGSDERRQAAKPTGKPTTCADVDIGECCENRTTAEAVKLPTSSSTPSTVASLIVDTFVNQDFDGQVLKPDHSKPESPSYTQLTTLIAGDSDVRTSAKERQLQPNKPQTIRQIRKLLDGFKVQSSAKTSLMGAPLKELLGSVARRPQPQRDTLPIKPRQNAQEIEQTQIRLNSLNNSKSGRPKVVIERAADSSGRNFRSREKTSSARGKGPAQTGLLWAKNALQMKSNPQNHQSREQTNFSGVRIFLEQVKLGAASVEDSYRTIVQQVHEADAMFAPKKPARSRMCRKPPKGIRRLLEKRRIYERPDLVFTVQDVRQLLHKIDPFYVDTPKQWPLDWHFPLNYGTCVHMSFGGDSANTYVAHDENGPEDITRIDAKKELGRTKDVILIERVQRVVTKMAAGLKSMGYEKPPRGLISYYALFEQGLANRVFTFDPATHGGDMNSVQNTIEHLFKRVLALASIRLRAENLKSSATRFFTRAFQAVVTNGALCWALILGSTNKFDTLRWFQPAHKRPYGVSRKHFGSKTALESPSDQLQAGTLKIFKQNEFKHSKCDIAWVTSRSHQRFDNLRKKRVSQKQSFWNSADRPRRVKSRSGYGKPSQNSKGAFFVMSGCADVAGRQNDDQGEGMEIVRQTERKLC
ncbi:hypothetical protein CLF_110489 [Clonorchis sinensis]|uniref:Uncharacterized protein n=1 Tax=Clonorchis sinensis TaxID=79923 RepID=G7YTJ5_CLOSI|nr:hypothetical protein CLF_110489 [Clonorchis sinensis]